MKNLITIILAERLELKLIPKFLRFLPVEVIGAGGTPSKKYFITLNFGYAGSRDRNLKMNKTYKIGRKIKCETYAEFQNNLSEKSRTLVDMELANIKEMSLLCFSFKTVSDYCNYDEYKGFLK